EDNCLFDRVHDGDIGLELDHQFLRQRGNLPAILGDDQDSHVGAVHCASFNFRVSNSVLTASMLKLANNGRRGDSALRARGGGREAYTSRSARDSDAMPWMSPNQTARPENSNDP